MSRSNRDNLFWLEPSVARTIWRGANAAVFGLAALAPSSCTTFGEISVANAGGGGSSAANGGGGGSDPANDPCTPGSERSCYSGAAETAYVGLCVSGKRICKLDGLGFGDCEGEVLPETETCGNPADEDCDGLTNEDGADCNCTPGAEIACYSAAPATKDVGPCKAGSQACNEEGNGYRACDGELTPKAETCDTSFDDDCDGSVNEEGDSCVCIPGATEDCSDAPSGKAGVGACVMGSRACNSAGTEWGSCDGDVSPTSAEACNNGKDDDCNGQTDDGCSCTSGQTQSCYSGTDETKGVGSCQAGSQSCASNGTWGNCSGEVLPTSENCTTSADDDCDGAANESAAGCVCTPGATESCYTGPSGTENVGVCESGTRTCASTGKSWGPCDGQTLPEASELCDNGEDDNCAAGVDEGCSIPCAPTGWAASLTLPGATDAQLAIDSTGGVWVAYLFNNELRVAHKPAVGIWETAVWVDASTGLFSAPAIGVDDADGVWVAFNGWADKDLKVAHKPSGAAWETPVVVDATAGDFSSPSIAIDGAGGVWVSYEGAGQAVKVTHKPSGSSWQAPVDLDPGVYSSVATDSTGGVWVTYTSLSADETKVSHKPSGATWETPVVLEATYSQTPSIAIDATDGVWVSYGAEGTTDFLKVVHKPASGTWQTPVTVDAGGAESAIAIDALGGIWVSYSPNTTGAETYLSLVHKPAGASWQAPVVVDSTSNTGNNTSLGIDATGGVWVSYTHYDPDGNETKVAYACP